MRGDLADVRLAERVFAPHYAAPMAVQLGQPVALREAADANSPMIVAMAAGEVFEVLELAGGNAWGIACDSGLVGYIDAAAIGGRVK